MIRDGDEIPLSAEIVDKIGIKNDEKRKQKGNNEANGKAIESKEPGNVESKADDDWVLQLNKSTQNEGEEDKKEVFKKLKEIAIF
jgi:hypothetical protein